jgi:hypothetical protein
MQALSKSQREQVLRREAHRRFQPHAGARPYVGYGVGALSDRIGLFTGDTLFTARASAGAAGAQWDVGATLPVYSLAGGSSETGLGAPRLHAGYELVPQFDKRPALYASALAAVPTTGEATALQSGQLTRGVSGGLSRTWPGYRGAVVLGLIQPGDPAAGHNRNVFFYGVRASEQREDGRVYGALQWRTGFRPGVDEATEIQAGMTYATGGGRVLSGEAFLGFITGTPRIGVRVGVLRWL